MDDYIDKITKLCQITRTEKWGFLRKTLHSAPNFLLFGPPGTGKSSIIQAVAVKLTESDPNTIYFKVNLDSLVDKGLGETSKSIHQLFSTVKDSASKGFICLLHLDDIDSILTTRLTTEESSGIKRAVVTFLLELDDLLNIEQPPIIMATTNIPFIIDTAIKRRFPFQLEVDPQLSESIIEELISPIVNELNIKELVDYAKIAKVVKKRKLTANDILNQMHAIYIKSIFGDEINIKSIMKSLKDTSKKS